jgi:hypothetical protein
MGEGRRMLTVVYRDAGGGSVTATADEHPGPEGRGRSQAEARANLVAALVAASPDPPARRPGDVLRRAAAWVGGAVDEVVRPRRRRGARRGGLR